SKHTDLRPDDLDLRLLSFLGAYELLCCKPGWLDDAWVERPSQAHGTSFKFWCRARDGHAARIASTPSHRSTGDEPYAGVGRAALAGCALATEADRDGAQRQSGRAASSAHSVSSAFAIAALISCSSAWGSRQARDVARTRVLRPDGGPNRVLRR